MWNPFRQRRSLQQPHRSPSDLATPTPGWVPEFGHALSSPTGRTAEDNWDLRFPQSTRIFAKMGREDAQVTSVMKAITLPIQRADWRLDPNGAPAEIVALVSDDLRLPVLGDDAQKPVGRRRGRVSWGEHLQQAMLSLKFGCMFFEQVYAVGPDGRTHLRKLAPRFPGTLSKITVAADGGLASIEQQGVSVGKATGAAATIPVSHLVAYVHAPEDTSWTGTSVLRPAYKHWKLRDEMLRLEAMVLERNGMGVPRYRGTELTNDPVGDLARGQKIASELRSGTAAGASIPAGADLAILGVSGQLVSPREAISYHDAMMAKAVLAHFLNLDGGGGSYALAETQSDLFIQSLQTIADWIADTATQHIVEDLVDLAFPDWSGQCPRIIVDPIASKKELAMDVLATLVDKGVIQMDKTLEEHIRRVSSLPAKRPFKEAVDAGDAVPKDEEMKTADPAELAQLAAAQKALTEAGMSTEDAQKITGLDKLLEHDEPDPGAPPGTDTEGEVPANG